MLVYWRAIQCWSLADLWLPQSWTGRNRAHQAPEGGLEGGGLSGVSENVSERLWGYDMNVTTVSGWWFYFFLILHNIWDFSRRFKPPTRYGSVWDFHGVEWMLKGC
jgi:hypothetical protein